MLNVTTQSVTRYDLAGEMKFERTVKNRRIIIKENLVEYLHKHGLIYMDNGRVDVVYARVSTHKQREQGDLDRQAETVATFASTKNPQNLEIITEVGSGLNDNRRELRKLIKRRDGSADRVSEKFRVVSIDKVVKTYTTADGMVMEFLGSVLTEAEINELTVEQMNESSNWLAEKIGMLKEVIPCGVKQTKIE